MKQLISMFALFFAFFSSSLMAEPQPYTQAGFDALQKEGKPTLVHIHADANELGHVYQADLAINATPLGMQPDDPLPWDLSALRPGTIVGDVTTKPDTPPFIAEAERRGAAVVRGRDMHEGQIRALCAFFGFELR